MSSVQAGVRATSRDEIQVGYELFRRGGLDLGGFLGALWDIQQEQPKPLDLGTTLRTTPDLPKCSCAT